MYTRESFERQRVAVRRVERRDGSLLAAVSVGLGFAQMIFFRWADVNLVRHTRIVIGGLAFLAYLALVAVLFWRYLRRRQAARPKCPQCGASLDDLGLRITAATGRCDHCGGQVIE